MRAEDQYEELNLLVNRAAAGLRQAGFRPGGELNPLFKVERLVTLDELPRTASNKIMRRVLRDRAARILERRGRGGPIIDTGLRVR